MKLKTIGQIKTIDLTNKTFTIEPLAAYKFTPDPEKEDDWKIILRKEDSTELKLRGKDTKFTFNENLASAMVILKQSKTRIEVSIEVSQKKTGKRSCVAEISIP